jgi:hypothetical protein
MHSLDSADKSPRDEAVRLDMVRRLRVVKAVMEHLTQKITL